MRKTLGSVISAIVILGGIILQGPWHALDVVGRILTMLDMPETFNHLIDWLAAHPMLAVDIGPWILIGGGIASLIAIHAQSLRPLTMRVSGYQIEQSLNVSQYHEEPSAGSVTLTSKSIRELSTMVLGAKVFSLTSGLHLLGMQIDSQIRPTEYELATLKRSLNDPIDDSKLAGILQQIEDITKIIDEREDAYRISTLSQFNAKFKTEAILLGDELSRRTGITVCDIKDPTTSLLDRGEPSQISELGTVASFLQKMAEQLPKQ